MKKALIILVLLLVSIDGFGREKTKTPIPQKQTQNSNDSIERKKDTLIDRKIRTFVIEYDFQTGKFPYGEKIKPRVDVPIVFKIKNINRLAYSVNITSKDSVIGFSDLENLELLLKQNEVKEIAKNIKEAETNPPLQTNNLPININDLLYNEIKKADKPLTSKGAETLVNDINKTNVVFLEQLNTKINELSTNNKTIITKINSDSKTLPTSIEQKFPYHFKTQADLANLYLLILQKHKSLFTLWNDFLQVNTIINNPLLTNVDLKKDSINILSIYEKFKNNRNILNDFNLLVTSFENQYNTLKANPEIKNQANYGGSIKLFSIVDNLNIEVKAIKQQTEAIKFETLRQNIDQIHSLLIVNDDIDPLFEYVSDPIQPFQDVVIFRVKVDKNNKDASLFYNERNFSYKEFTRHGIRLDLNIGVAGSFYNKDNFYEIKADSLDINRITKTNKSGFSPSFVGFFTTSYRSATHWSYGLSTGLGISADAGTITLDNFFIGPSLIVGRYERINLTTGVSFKNLGKLNSGFKEGQVLPNATTIEAVTTKSYEPGFFIALTFNLTKAVKNNVKQIKNFL